MNYITEINAFYRWLGANPLKGPEIVLWHALMSIANDASNDADWQMQITPAISTLQSRCGLGKDSIFNARNKLKQLKRIDFKSRGGNLSATYIIIPFVSDIPTQITAQVPTQVPTQFTAQVPTQTPTIYKLNKTKQNIISCKELSASAETPCRTPAITLALNDKSEYPVFEEHVHEWAALYPAVDVIQQLRGMKGWLNANPTKRKTKSGIKRFINSWLAKEQDKGGGKNSSKTNGSPWGYNKEVL